MTGRGAKPSAKTPGALGHSRDELLVTSLLDQQAGVIAAERLEHHQLGPQQPDAVDVEPLGVLDLGGL